VNFSDIQPRGVGIINTFGDNDLSVKERIRLDIVQLQLHLLHIASVFFIKVEEADIILLELGIFLVHVYNSSDKSLGVMNWEAKLIKCVDTQLLFESVLNYFKVLFKALNSTSSCEVQEVIGLHLRCRLESHDALLIIDSWNLVDAIIEGDSLQSLRLS